jgi:hypothetical protein
MLGVIIETKNVYLCEFFNGSFCVRKSKVSLCEIRIEFQILIVVLPCILISSKLLCQQMHSLLKHKILQLTLKISLYMAPTCFGPFGPSSGSILRNLAKVTAFVEIISKNTSLKWLLCSGNMCCVYWVLCGV